MNEIAGRWLRVSTGGQDEANQEPDVDRWISDHKYSPGPTYRLHGKSASKGKHQDALDEVVADMKAGKLTVLVVWHFDRIERRGAWNAFDLARRVKEAGGRIEYVLTPHLNEMHDFSDTFLAMESDRAKAESKRISERVLGAHNRIRSNGGALGRPSYGYRVAGERYNKRFVVHELEARVIQEAKDRYLEGETIDAIVNDLNARRIYRGVCKGKPQIWYAKTLAALLRSPTIAGRRIDARGKTVATFDPIITMDEHRRLVARLDSRAHRRGISPGNVALLTSLLFDADGNPMYRINSWGGQLYYSRKSKMSVDLEEMNSRVERIFAGSSEPYLIPRLVPGKNNGDEIAHLRQDRAELDDMSPDYEKRHAKLTARIRELVRQDEENPNPDRIEMVDSGKTYGEVWQKMSTAERRDILRTRGVTIVWLGDDQWEIGFGEGEMEVGALGVEATVMARGLRLRMRGHEMVGVAAEATW